MQTRLTIEELWPLSDEEAAQKIGAFLRELEIEKETAGTGGLDLLSLVQEGLRKPSLWDEIAEILEQAPALSEEDWSGFWEANLIADEYRGYKRVSFALFKQDQTEETSRARAIQAGITNQALLEDLYFLSQIEEMFTAQEIEVLKEFFSLWEGVELEIKPAREPVKDGWGVGANAVGGPTDFYMFSEMEGYPLPFKVWGYYNLEFSERAGQQGLEPAS